MDKKIFLLLPIVFVVLNASNVLASDDVLKNSNLSNIASQDNLNLDVMFEDGRKAYKLGKFNKALNIYILMLQKNPANNRVKLELAMTYYKLGDFKRANDLFKNVLQDKNLPQNVRKNIENLLVNLNAKQDIKSDHFFNTMLSVGYGYDSNVKNNTDDKYVYLGRLPLELDSKVSDHFSEYVLVLNHTYESELGLESGNKFVGFLQDYKKYDDKDLGLFLIGNGVKSNFDKFSIGVDFDFSRVWIDNKTYLNNFTISPNFIYFLNTNLINKTTLKFNKKFFIQDEDRFRNSNYYEFENVLSVKTQNFGTNSFAFVAGKDISVDRPSYGVDYDFWGIKLKNNYPVFDKTSLNFGFEYQKEKYKATELVIYKTKRKNEKFGYEFGVTQSLRENLIFALNFKYTDIKSNQNIYTYDKQIIKANLYYIF